MNVEHIGLYLGLDNHWLEQLWISLPNHVYMWQVPITVHFDHGTSKQDLVEALELVMFIFTCIKFLPIEPFQSQRWCGMHSWLVIALLCPYFSKVKLHLWCNDSRDSILWWQMVHIFPSMKMPHTQNLYHYWLTQKICWLKLS